MKPNEPARPLERFALLIVAAVASLSVMSGAVLLLNHEEQGAVAYATGCVPAQASSTSTNATTAAGCRP